MKLVVTLLAILVSVQAYKSYSGYQVLRTLPLTKETVQYLEPLTHVPDFDFWVGPAVGRPAHIMTSAKNVPALRFELQRLGLEPSVLVSDVGEMVAREREANERAKRSTRTGERAPILDRFLTYDEIQAYLDEVVTNFPSIASIIDIGTSYEGRALRVLKLSNGPGKQGIWFDTVIHAREWIGPPVAMYAISQLTDNLAQNQAMLDANDFYFQPTINPDGYEYTWTDDRFWRKTRSPNPGSICVGTDANRNFDYQWAGGGVPSPCSDTYPGSAPNSEPEIKAMADFLTNNPSITFAVALHSAAQLILTPWSWTLEHPVHYDEMMRVGTEAAAALEAVSGTVYDVGSSADLLYFSYGNSKDWAYGALNISYSYTVELPPGGSGDFNPPPQDIIPVATETWEAIKVFAANIPPTVCCWPSAEEPCPTSRMMGLVTNLELATSTEGRRVRGVKISSGSGKKAVWQDCVIHAREWLAAPVCMNVIETVLADSTLQAMVDWYILPVANPDGYAYTHTDERLWRKTRRPNPGSNCVGTDGNRNFPYHWNLGNNNNYCADDYPGDRAYSEPECAGIGSIVDPLAAAGDLVLYIATHSYGALLLYPWGDTAELAPTQPILQSSGDTAAAIIQSFRGTTYSVEQASTGLYFTYGASDDHAYASGASMAYTFELPGGGLWGFNPPPSEILPCVTETVPGIISLQSVCHLAVMKLFCAVLLALCGGALSYVTYDGYQVLRTNEVPEAVFPALLELTKNNDYDFWTSPRVGTRMVIMAGPEHLLIYPWGDTSDPAPNQAVMQAAGDAAAAIIRSYRGTRYTVEQSSTGLYFTYGASDDHAYASGASMAYTFELPGGGLWGFNPPPSEILPCVTETVPGIISLLDFARGDEDICCYPQTPRVSMYQVLRTREVPEVMFPALLELTRNNDYDFWTKPRVGSRMVIMAGPEHVDFLRVSLHRLRLNPEVYIPDVGLTVRRERSANDDARMKSSRKYRAASYDHFMTYDEYNLVTNIEVATSTEGRRVRAIKISSGPGKKAFFQDCVIHAREWLAAPVCMKVIEDVIASPQLQIKVDWYILPIANPDGYVYSHTDDRLWRKTRRPNPGSNCVGTDGNRNFDYNWNLNMNNDTCSLDYPGEVAFSEPECKGMADIIEPLASRGELLLYVSTHSYGQLLLYPWGDKPDPAPNAIPLERSGIRAAVIIESSRGTQYTVTPAGSVSYVYGASDDYSYAKGANMVYTFELPGGGSWGFDPPPTEILPCVTETVYKVLQTREVPEMMIPALKELQRNNEYDFWSEPVEGHRVQIMAEPEQVDMLQIELSRLRLSPEVFISDIGETVRREREAIEAASRDKPRPPRAAVYDRYMSPNELMMFLHEVIDSNQTIASLFNLGVSWEGRPMHGIKISSGPGKKTALILCLQNPREWITAPVCTKTIEDVMASTELQNLVDCNTYPGDEPFSETETRVIADFVKTMGQSGQLVVLISLHSYSKIAAGNAAALEIATFRGTEYTVKQSGALSTDNYGSCEDYAFDVGKVRYSAMKLLIILCFCLLSHVTALKSYKGYTVYKTQAKPRVRMFVMAELMTKDPNYDFWWPPHAHQSMLVMTSPAQSENLFYQLSFVDAGPEKVIEDLEKVLEIENEEIERLKRDEPLKDGDVTFKRYMEYNEIRHHVQQVIEEHQDVASALHLTLSTEGRSLSGVKLSSGPGKKGVWLNCGMQGREWMSVAVCLWSLSEVLANPRLLDIVDWYILPVANPDGYVYSWEEDRFWKKTRGETSNPSCPGSDMNRNFGHFWNVENNTDPCSGTFPGTEAFSEQEAMGIGDLLTLLGSKRELLLYLNVQNYVQASKHFYNVPKFVSYFQLSAAQIANSILYPWGYTTSPAPNTEKLMEAAEVMSVAIQKKGNLTYQVGSTADILYTASGNSEDHAHAHGAANIPYALTLGLPRGVHETLNPPASNIVRTCNNLYAGIRALVKHVAATQTRVRDDL
ncbi:hypothetical protein B566_EDAN010423 [Ephemera danica]|nr:hypothetical protein B566_EDAN010423 [Ephemera danica]